MKAYWQLTLAQLRIFARNPQVLFFTLLFPIILMLALGSFLGNSGGTSIYMAVVDHDGSTASKQLLSTLSENDAIQLDKSSDVNEALDELKNNEYQVVMEIPEGYGDQLQSHTDESKAFDLPVYYNETDASASQLGLTVVESAVDQVSKNIENYSPVVAVQPEGVRALDLGYIDFLVPGIVAMMIMNNNMNGVAGQISAWRERGILRRMQGTRLKASTFIAAQITARVILNGLQALLVLMVASLLFQVQVNGSWLALLTFVVLGTLAFMAIGFIIAGLAKNPESAGPIAAFASFPMLFLGGVFFSINTMPEYLQPIVHILPISHLSTALRETMNVGTPFFDLWTHWLTLAAWLVGAFIIASRTFKWE
ncbi:ABC-2 type transport system permease protein [Halobacillus alkaliphilus]|uniref:ABC-2 type transport system permease protein n=1 Tax=Halobacillus alkaliphilus TaxID=396056 RepID=A0A1I2QTL6_9BACI|nr:ABC transporter permease [Halobacillus alkaliphilus]SFG31762.1 ABC-2 type transport system permease protein [Halobacillus alkaliphilus]